MHGVLLRCLFFNRYMHVYHVYLRYAGLDVLVRDRGNPGKSKITGQRDVDGVVSR